MSTYTLCVTALLQGCSSAHASFYTLFAFIDPCCQAVDGFLAELPIPVCAGVLRHKSNLGDQDKTTAAARLWPHCVSKVTSKCDSPSRQCRAIQGLCTCCQADCQGGRHQGLLQRPSALSLSGTHARPIASSRLPALQSVCSPPFSGSCMQSEMLSEI